MLYSLGREEGSSIHLCSGILPVLHLVTPLHKEFSLWASCWLQNQAQLLSGPHSALRLLSLALSSPLSLQCLQHILSDHARSLLSECTTCYVHPVPTPWMLKWSCFFYVPSEKSICPPPCSLGPLFIALFQAPNVVIILWFLCQPHETCYGQVLYLILNRIQNTRGTKVRLFCLIHSHNLLIVLSSVVILSPFNENVLDLGTSFSLQSRSDRLKYVLNLCCQSNFFEL